MLARPHAGLDARHWLVQMCAYDHRNDGESREILEHLLAAAGVRILERNERNNEMALLWLGSPVEYPLK
jgi:hypothetical protein